MDITTRKELFEKLVDLVCEFDRVCKEHSITYYTDIKIKAESNSEGEPQQ